MISGPARAEFTPTGAFIVHDDGTVTHRLTGLMWKRCPEGMLWNGETCDGTATPGQSVSVLLVGHDFAGYSDWRLPTAWEMLSLVDYDLAYPGPSINTTLFPATPRDGFWTGTSLAGDVTQAWYLNFYLGTTGVAPRDQPGYLRLVRGGPQVEVGAARYIDHGDGTVTDKLTQLQWKRCVEGMTWNGTTCTGSPAAISSNSARVLTASFAGKSDWRVPNLQELSSITDFSRTSPAIDSTIFPGTPASYLWSSTDFGAVSFNAWAVNFMSGEIETVIRIDNHPVRLVRGAQAPLNSGSTELTDVACLFSWAEQQLADYFSPANSQNLSYADIIYRAYPQTGIYLGFRNSRVLITGGVFGDQLHDLGAMSDYLPQARASVCR